LQDSKKSGQQSAISGQPESGGVGNWLKAKLNAENFPKKAVSSSAISCQPESGGVGNWLKADR
jgi:hypothetical protein